MTVDAPVITVVTPTVAGREDLLAECQDSVRRAGLPHVIGLDTERRGPAYMRNQLLVEVTTEWVLYLDDDDLLYPNYAIAVESHLPDADVVYTSWRLTGDATGPYPVPFDPDRLIAENFIPVTACVRTEAVRTVGGFPENTRYEDHELWKRLLAAGYRFAYVPVVAWQYRRRPGSRTDAAG